MKGVLRNQYCVPHAPYPAGAESAVGKPEATARADPSACRPINRSPCKARAGTESVPGEAGRLERRGGRAELRLRAAHPDLGCRPVEVCEAVLQTLSEFSAKRSPRTGPEVQEMPQAPWFQTDAEGGVRGDVQGAKVILHSPLVSPRPVACAAEKERGFRCQPEQCSKATADSVAEQGAAHESAKDALDNPTQMGTGYRAMSKEDTKTAVVKAKVMPGANPAAVEMYLKKKAEEKTVIVLS